MELPVCGYTKLSSVMIKLILYCPTRFCNAVAVTVRSNCRVDELYELLITSTATLVVGAVLYLCETTPVHVV